MKLRYLLALSFCVCYSVVVSAQAPPPPPPPGLPIDGGILFLLLAGLFFGVRKIKKS